MTAAAAVDAPRDDELALARCAAQGEARACDALMRQVVGRVRRVARALCRSASDADDAAQQSLLEILRSIRTFRGDSPLEHWASRIAARTCLRWSVTERRRRAVPVDQAAWPADDDTAFALARDVRAYLERISHPQRDAIVLHHALGYSLDEIGELTGVSPNTVKSRLRLGMAALRDAVRGDESTNATEGGTP